MLPLLRSLRGREASPPKSTPSAGKMKKQMEYANRRGIPYVVIVGSQELEAGAATVRTCVRVSSVRLPLDALAAKFGVPAFGIAPRKPISGSCCGTGL